MTVSEDESPSEPESRWAIAAARLIVATAGIALCVLGVGLAWLTWDEIVNGGLWWALVCWLALFACGVWFIWSAVKPRRKHFIDICATIEAGILE